MENDEMDLDNPINVPKDEGGEPSEKAPDGTPKNKELEEKNKQLFERAKKAEQENKELKAKFLKEEPKKDEPKGTNQNDPKTMVRLSKALADFSEEELEIIYRLAKDSSPEAIIEASKEEWVKNAITANREKVAKEKQIPEPGKLPGAESKKGLTLEDIEKDPTSHKKAWEEHMKKTGMQGTGI